MAASAIKNPSVEICAMPAPFQGVLKGGQSIILSYTPVQLATMCPSLDDAFVVTDLGSYSGATDDADFGPITDEATTFEAPVTIAPAAVTSVGQVALTVTGAADTGITASTERSDVYFNLNRTATWATGALATQRAVRIAAPTYAFAGASTITNAVTLDISGAPAAGANATITNAYALRVASGSSRFAGAVGMDSTLNVIGAATFSAAAEVSIKDATTNGITRGLTLAHMAFGTVAAGIGTGLLLQAESDAGTLRNAGAVDAVHTSAADGAEVSALILSAGRAGALVEAARFVAPGSAVNSLSVSGSVTGNAVAALPQGTDADCGLNISGKGTGALSLLSGAGTTLMSFANAGVTMYSDTQLGAGPTISRPSGIVQIDNGATTVTVTNTLVSATSQIWAQIRNATTNPVSVLNVVPGAGSFVINLSGDPGASHAQLNFLVLNPNA